MQFILTMPIFAYIYLHEKFALRFVLIWIVVAFVIHLVDKNIYKGWFSQSCELKAEEIYDSFFYVILSLKNSIMYLVIYRMELFKVWLLCSNTQWWKYEHIHILSITKNLSLLPRSLLLQASSLGRIQRRTISVCYFLATIIQVKMRP